VIPLDAFKTKPRKDRDLDFYNKIFRLALDTVNEHGSYDDFVAAAPISTGTSRRNMPTATRKLIWEIAYFTLNPWLKE
jgi:hypothetical protein